MVEEFAAGSGWSPANEVERQLADALSAGDSQRYARLLLEAPVYLPVFPDEGSELWDELVERLPLNHDVVLVFTSVEAISLVLGDFAVDREHASLPEVLDNWPESSEMLAINPALPIGAVLPPDGLRQLCEGERSLVAIADVDDEIERYFQQGLRRNCLDELGGTEQPDPVPPSTEIETELAVAVTEQDPDAYLTALLMADVVLPTVEPVAEQRIDSTDFPWWTVGAAIPVFSSPAMRSRIAPLVRDWVQVPFVQLLAHWPSDEHTLCLNLGTDTELILLGKHVLELLEAVAETSNTGKTSEEGH